MNHRSVLAAVSLAALAAAASADVDVVVGNADVVAGTLSPASENETFRVTCPKGATLFVKAKAAKKGLTLRVSILDAGNASLGLFTGKSVSLKTKPLAATGEYVVTVRSGDGETTGDYSLVISWKNPPSVAVTADVAASQTATLSFGADAGAVATISAKKAGKTSAAVPSLVGLAGPTSSPAVGPAATAKVTLPELGEYVLTFANTGATAGAITATVKLKPPKPTKRKLALRRSAIGEGGISGGVAFGSLVSSAGGVVGVPVLPFSSPGGPLAGTSVSIPTGALAAPTAILIATAPALTPLDGQSGAGPTAFFGPEGTRFDKSDVAARATITIPYDPAFESATATFVVYTRDARGKVTAVDPPYTIDHSAHTVSFATSHFSSFRVGAPGGPTDPTLRTVALLDDPIDICEAYAPPGKPARYKFFVADDDEDTVFGLVPRPGGDPTLDPELFVGNGESSDDGTQRLKFFFPTSITCVSARRDGQVFAGTRTQIYRIAANGIVTRYAGTGPSADAGDEGPARAAQFNLIVSILADDQGRIFVCDAGASRIRVIDKSGVVHAWAGNGENAFGTDGVAPADTTFLDLHRIEFARAGGLFVADAARVRRIDPVAGVNVTFAGDANGGSGAAIDGVSLSVTRFYVAHGIGAYFDAAQQKEFVAVADSSDGTVHLLDAAADLMTSVAGLSDTSGNAPDAPGPVIRAINPSAVRFAAEGTYVVDRQAGKIRFVTR
jgi:hypothetical protein